MRKYFEHIMIKRIVDYVITNDVICNFAIHRMSIIINAYVDGENAETRTEVYTGA